MRALCGRLSWRVECLNRRQIAFEAFDLDGTELTGAALCQCRRAGVTCQHVRVSVYAERLVFLWVRWIIPGARGKLHHAWADILCEPRRGKTSATSIEKANDVRVNDSARPCINWMYPCHLASTLLGLGAMFAKVELTVQTVRGLVRR
jgi:hypothetical protein